MKRCRPPGGGSEKTGSDAFSAAEQTIASQKIAIIKELLPFWKTVLSEYETVRSTFLSLPANELALGKVMSRFPDGSLIAPKLEPFRKPLVAAANDLFAPIPTSGEENAPVRLPTTAEYSARLAAFQAALEEKRKPAKGRPQTSIVESICRVIPAGRLRLDHRGDEHHDSQPGYAVLCHRGSACRHY